MVRRPLRSRRLRHLLAELRDGGLGWRGEMAPTDVDARGRGAVLSGPAGPHRHDAAEVVASRAGGALLCGTGHPADARPQPGGVHVAPVSHGPAALWSRNR